jgi:hypothetical protein
MCEAVGTFCEGDIAPYFVFKDVVLPLGSLNATPPKGGTPICLQLM